MPSPFFIPVPAKIQCFSWTQIQSRPARSRGRRLRAPISVASFGPLCCRAAAPPEAPFLAHSSMRAELPDPADHAVGRPGRALGRNGITPQQVSPLKKATFSPAAIAALTFSYISSDQYSSWPTESKRLRPQQPLGVGVRVDVADVGDVVALLLHPEGQRKLPEQKLARALRQRRVDDLAILAVGPVPAHARRPDPSTIPSCHRRTATTGSGQRL